MKNKALHLFVGRSGAGKTTAANHLENVFNTKQVFSYTTRKPRYDGEQGHIFITDDEFDKLDNIVAYTEYNGARYCTTKEQLDNAIIYVIDVDGIDVLLDRYVTERPIHIWYFDSSIITRIHRMTDRGDADYAIVDRLINDEHCDWYDRLRILVGYYQSFKNKYNVELHSVDADQPIHEVVYEIKEYMEEWCL